MSHSQEPRQDTRLEIPAAILPELHWSTTNKTADSRESSSTTISRAAAHSTDSHETAVVGTSPPSTHEQPDGKGMMLRLVGKKLGAYNLRGVVAGMDLLGMGGAGSEKAGGGSGKLLHTKNRRQKRISKSPYEKRTKSTDTDSKRDSGGHTWRITTQRDTTKERTGGRGQCEEHL